MTFRAKFVPVGLMAPLLLLGGCAALPQSGPISNRIYRDSRQGDFSLLEVDSEGTLPPGPDVSDFTPLPPGFAVEAQVISPGDVLDVSYYEVGARLFSAASGAPATYDASAKRTSLGPVPVDRDGIIRLPYTGEIRAAGMTTRQLAEAIEGRLRTKSENPQVMIRIDSANGSSVMVSGEVGRTGRIPLTGAREKLLDIISLAGGPRGTPESVMVSVNRHGLKSEGPLEKLTYENFGGTLMEAGDRVQLLRKPWVYSVLGSANRINRFDLPLRRLSLVEALAQAGGPNEYTANPAAVFVFRYVADGTPGEKGEKPTVYHVNMLKPASYLLAQRFWLKDKDVVYIAGADANQPSKMLQIIGQVFTPIAIARQVTY